MKYLSYQRNKDNGQIEAVASETIDQHSKFQPDGNLYALEGIAIGFNVIVFGVRAPNGLICFQRKPMFSDGWDANTPGDFGRVHEQTDGTVAIEWPL